VVFEDHHDLNRRIDDPNLDVRPDAVLVLRNAGPVGGPGMPEWGFLPIPRKLLAAGVRDMVRVSDARMSGTAFGTVVVHVAPESAVGGRSGRGRCPGRSAGTGCCTPGRCCRRTAAATSTSSAPPGRGRRDLYP